MQAIDLTGLVNLAREQGAVLESAVTRLSASDYQALSVASRRVTAWLRLED